MPRARGLSSLRRAEADFSGASWGHRASSHRRPATAAAAGAMRRIQRDDDQFAAHQQTLSMWRRRLLRRIHAAISDDIALRSPLTRDITRRDAASIPKPLLCRRKNVRFLMMLMMIAQEISPCMPAGVFPYLISFR